MSEAAGGEGLSTILARVGVKTRVIPAPAWNLELTTPEDRALARAIE